MKHKIQQLLKGSIATFLALVMFVLSSGCGFMGETLGFMKSPEFSLVKFEPVSQVINVNGGEINAGENKLIVPVEALKEAQELSLTPLVRGNNSIGIELNPHGIVFAKRVTVRIKVNQSLTPGTFIPIQYLEQNTNQFVPAKFTNGNEIMGFVLETGYTVEFQTDHFSTFMINLLAKDKLRGDIDPDDTHSFSVSDGTQLWIPFEFCYYCKKRDPVTLDADAHYLATVFQWNSSAVDAVFGPETGSFKRYIEDNQIPEYQINDPTKLASTDLLKSLVYELIRQPDRSLNEDQDLSKTYQSLVNFIDSLENAKELAEKSDYVANQIIVLLPAGTAISDVKDLVKLISNFKDVFSTSAQIMKAQLSVLIIYVISLDIQKARLKELKNYIASAPKVSFSTKLNDAVKSVEDELKALSGSMEEKTRKLLTEMAIAGVNKAIEFGSDWLVDRGIEFMIFLVAPIALPLAPSFQYGVRQYVKAIEHEKKWKSDRRSLILLTTLGKQILGKVTTTDNEEISEIKVYLNYLYYKNLLEQEQEYRVKFLGQKLNNIDRASQLETKRDNYLKILQQIPSSGQSASSSKTQTICLQADEDRASQMLKKFSGELKKISEDSQKFIYEPLLEVSEDIKFAPDNNPELGEDKGRDNVWLEIYNGKVQQWYGFSLLKSQSAKSGFKIYDRFINADKEHTRLRQKSLLKNIVYKYRFKFVTNDGKKYYLIKDQIIPEPCLAQSKGKDQDGVAIGSSSSESGDKKPLQASSPLTGGGSVIPGSSLSPVQGGLPPQ